MREKLAELKEFDHQVDWSDGKRFPWWFLLANTGTIRDVANHGISNARLQVTDGVKRVVVDSVQGTYHSMSAPRTGKMQVESSPRLYKG